MDCSLIVWVGMQSIDNGERGNLSLHQVGYSQWQTSVRILYNRQRQTNSRASFLLNTLGTKILSRIQISLSPCIGARIISCIQQEKKKNCHVNKILTSMLKYNLKSCIVTRTIFVNCFQKWMGQTEIGNMMYPKNPQHN